MVLQNEIGDSKGNMQCFKTYSYHFFKRDFHNLCFKNYLIFDVVLTDMQNIYLVCIEFHCISCHFKCNVKGQIVLKIAEMKLTVTLLCSYGSKTDLKSVIVHIEY